MKNIIIFLYFIPSLALIFCSNPVPREEKPFSRILKFDDIGYGDTCWAILYGTVFENLDTSLVPLKGVTFKITPHPMIELATNTEVRKKIENKEFQLDSAVFNFDTSGNFSLPFLEGKFEILITKPGYQSIRLLYFEGDPDLYTYSEFVMVKDTGETVWDVSRGWWSE